MHALHAAPSPAARGSFPLNITPHAQRGMPPCLRYMRREASIVYVARQKVKGVPHHAKAGNINSCLLKEGAKKGEFVLVLDCDMSEWRLGAPRGALPISQAPVAGGGCGEGPFRRRRATQREAAGPTAAMLPGNLAS